MFFDVTSTVKSKWNKQGLGKQLLESEKERLAAHLSVTEREKREKETLIAKIQQENLQLRESVNQHLT